MKVGYAREPITPKESVPLDGYGNNAARLSKTVLDPLYVTCIAFEAEDGTRALVFAVDLLHTPGPWVAEILPAVSKATGVPADYIHISATHTHAGPDTRCTENAALVRYLGYLKEQTVRAAEAALADCKEAKLHLARAGTFRMNFVRHYILADGTYHTPNFGHPDRSPIVAHDGEPDTEMQLAKITRDGGKDIVLCNFQVHQTDTGGQMKHDVSADIAGAMRAEMEQKTGCLFAYFTGASGNINPESKIEEENILPYLDHIAHGKALAKYAMDAAQDYRPASFGAIRVGHAEHEAKINHTTDPLVPQAQEVVDLYTSTNDRAAANILARETYGFSSVYQAIAILERAQMPQTESIPASVLSVGDLAFVFAPYEMFDTNGVEIKRGSPFPMTMVLTLADRYGMGYFSDRATYAHGSYASDTCPFSAGIAEEMEALYIRMLKEIK